MLESSKLNVLMLDVTLLGRYWNMPHVSLRRLRFSAESASLDVTAKDGEKTSTSSEEDRRRDTAATERDMRDDE